jgi:histidinol-phosphate aminotransferase
MTAHLDPAVLALPRRPHSLRDGVLNLSSNELHHPALGPLLGEVLARVVPALAIQRYPSHEPARAAVAAHHGVPADRVLLTAGSDDGVRLIASTFARRCGRLVLQSPNYDRWETHARLAGIAVHAIRFGAVSPDAFAPEQLDVLERLDPSVVVVANPNSPTGAFLPLDELGELARRCGRRDHLLIVDACYGAFAGVEHAALLADHDHVIVLCSYSKTFGLAGARAAALLAPPALIDYLARFEPENPVSAPALALVQALVARRDELAAIHADIRRWRAALRAAVLDARPAWSALPSAANFVTFRTGAPAEAAAAAARLLAAGVRVRDCGAIEELRGCLRLTVADPATLAPVVALLGEPA